MASPVYELVDPAGIAGVGDVLAAARYVGLDTEFMRETTFYPRLCLLQIATRDRLLCIDPLGGNELVRLWELLVRPTWVLHAGRQDVEVLYLLTGRMPQRVFDNQIAAGLLGYPPQLGYAVLVTELFGVELPKAHTRADWSRRPLTAELLEYAAQDVEYLLPARDVLAERLEALGRLAWAEEDSRDLLDETLYAADPETAIRRLKGATRLKGRVRRAAAGLAAWREREAVARNRPRQWIMKDAALLEIATADPRDREALQRLGNLSPKTVGRAGGQVLRVLADARRASGTDPTSAPESGRATLKAMQDVVAAAARELEVMPEVIASRRDLSAALAGERGLRLFRGWRAGVAGDRLLDLLS